MQEIASYENRKQFGILNGSPSANDEIHMGHMMNRILKHIILLSQRDLRRNESLKCDWDWRELPIEAQVFKEVKYTGCLSFMCKIYAINWMKTRMLQLKFLGFCANKSRFAMTSSAQTLIAFGDAVLVKAGHIAFGKKTPAIWNPIKNKMIPENKPTVPTASTVSTAATSVSFVISKRRQLKRCKVATVLHTLTGMVGSRYKFLGQVFKMDSSKVWTIPWVTNLSVPSNGLKSTNLRGRLSICIPRIELAAASAIALLPTQLVKQLTVLNVFSKMHIPITSMCRKRMTAIGLASNNNTLLKLSTTARSTKRYSKQFRRRVVNLATRTVVGEIYVTNRLLTRGLIEKSDPASWQLVASCRANGSTTCCTSSQWYIRVDNDVKTRFCRMLAYVKFFTNITGYQLSKFLRTRPDWIVSRQRCWGVLSCFYGNRIGKVIWDEAFMRRIDALFNKRKNHLRKLT
ncbi:MAG: class I tRNA ligase family protein [Candidatus Hodgkinia cicadicola]